MKQGRGIPASSLLFQTYIHPMLTSLPKGFARMRCICKGRYKDNEEDVEK